MSGLVMGRVFYTELPGYLKLTLLALADHAEDDGSNVKIGQARLARKTGVSERAVRGHIADLREQGYIEKVGRVGPRGQDRHQIIVEKLPTSEQIALLFPQARPATAADRQPASDRKPSASRPEAQRHVDRKPVAANTSVNRPRNRQSAPRPRDLIHDALAEIEGAVPSQLTRPHARRIGVAAAEIRAVAPDVSPAEIHRRAGVYRRLHPEWELTANALAMHWAALSGSNGQRSAALDPETQSLVEAGVLRER